MADEQIEEEEGGGKKGGLVKIIMLVVGVVLVVLLTIGLTLYFTGFFDPGAEEVAEEQISALETEAAAAAEEVAQQPAKIQLEAPAVEKFETVYYELERVPRQCRKFSQSHADQAGNHDSL